MTIIKNSNIERLNKYNKMFFLEKILEKFKNIKKNEQKMNVVKNIF